jgi:hypothetical protein
VAATVATVAPTIDNGHGYDHRSDGYIATATATVAPLAATIAIVPSATRFPLTHAPRA